MEMAPDYIAPPCGAIAFVLPAGRSNPTNEAPPYKTSHPPSWELPMTRIPILVLLATLTTLGMQIPPAGMAVVTFNKDVFPILQENCQSCHRSGGIAPMSFTTYETARPWAKAIKAKVLSR